MDEVSTPTTKNKSIKNEKDKDVNDVEMNELLYNQLEEKDSTSSSHISVVEKDSEWTGLTYIRNESNDQPAEQTNVADLPIFVLFPNLGNVCPHQEQLLDRTLSTSEITRMLVELGEKADFSSLRLGEKMHVSESSSLDPIPEKSENVLWTSNLDNNNDGQPRDDCLCEKKSYNELNQVFSDMLITDRGRKQVDNKSPPCTKCTVCDKKCDKDERKI